MPRFKLTIEYDGSAFAGWQRQEDVPSVQGAIEQACEALDGAPVLVTGAGRTDSGVHATGQVAHIDLRKEMRADKVRDALNAHLRPHAIAILQSEDAAPDFHARFDATGRSYLYRIINRRADLALDRGKAWRVPVDLDAEAMHRAAQALVGRHDFSTFRDSQCQAETPVKTLNEMSVSRTGEEIAIRTSARSFLHRQVRSIVGSLVEVGRGRESESWIAEILAAADRTKCGQVSPPDGLYLVGVSYAPLEKEAQ
ncbi:MAG: tRNA pseudouridine(38-40) synthase TruA [Alphaproteobacteria bacterium]|nr:MAG: tRNA pseudouridine(38-40) synthase TruA [Alphaproteobacteria bacterium]